MAKSKNALRKCLFVDNWCGSIVVIVAVGKAKRNVIKNTKLCKLKSPDKALVFVIV